MIEARYPGRLGNHLFCYAFSRLLAEELGYALSAGSIDGFAGTLDRVEGKRIEKPIRKITGSEVVDFHAMLHNKEPQRIIVEGYVQRGEYYAPYRARIKKWLHMPDMIVRPGTQDLVMHVRLGDFVSCERILCFDYYKKILDTFRFHRIWLVTDDLNHEYLRRFKQYGVVPFKGNTLDCFRFLKSARNLLLSCSTFGWWAAFLSDASRIFYPVLKQSQEFWSHEGYAINDLRLPYPEFTYVDDVELESLH